MHEVPLHLVAWGFALSFALINAEAFRLRPTGSAATDPSSPLQGKSESGVGPGQLREHKGYFPKNRAILSLKTPILPMKMSF
jgi:hypothetical protein